MMTDRTETRTTAAVRAGWAVILLALPHRLLRAGAGGPVPPAAVAAGRLLAVRHLAQAGLSARPVMPWALGAVVDTVHAGSCIGLAAASARWRRVALIDALVEAGFAAASWHAWQRARSAPSR